MLREELGRGHGRRRDKRILREKEAGLWQMLEGIRKECVEEVGEMDMEEEEV